MPETRAKLSKPKEKIGNKQCIEAEQLEMKKARNEPEGTIKVSSEDD